MHKRSDKTLLFQSRRQCSTTGAAVCIGTVLLGLIGPSRPGYAIDCTDQSCTGTPPSYTEVTDQTTCTGETAIFTISPSNGDSFVWFYQTSKQDTGLVEDLSNPNYSGMTTPTLTIQNAGAAEAALTYFCIVLANDSSQCATCRASLTLIAAPTVDAGGPYTTCGTTAVSISGTANNAVSTTWTTSGTGVFDDAGVLSTTYTPSPDDVTAGSVTLTLTGNSPGCAPDTAVSNATLNIDNLNADAGPGYSSCGMTAVDIRGTSDLALTTTWTTSGTGSFEDAQAVVTTYTPSAEDVTAGMVTLTFTAENPNCTPSVASAQTSLTIDALPTVNAGGPYSICGTTAANISGSATNATTTTWTTSGTGSFGDASVLSTTYTPSAADVSAGSVTLTLTASNANCAPGLFTSNATLTITSLTANSGGNYSACGPNAVNITGTAPNAATHEWTTSGTGIFGDANALTTTYTPSASDVTAGSIMLTLTATNVDCTPSLATSNATLTINGLMSNAGGPYNGCNAAPVSISGTASSATSTTWTSTGTGNFGNNAALSTTYTPSAADVINGSVTLTLTANNAACSPDSVMSNATLLIGQITVSAGGPYNTCGRTVVNVTGTANNATTTMWTTSGTGNFGNPGLLNTTYTPTTADVLAGGVTLTLTANNASCSPSAIMSNAALTISPPPTSTPGGPYATCGTTAVNIAGSAGSAITTNWTTTGTGTFDDPGALSTTYTPSAGDVTLGTVLLTLTAQNPSCTPISVSRNATLNITPTPTSSAGGPYSVCDTSATSIAGTASNAATTLWSSNGTGTFGDASTLSTTYTPSLADVSAGNVTLTLTVNGQSPCMSVMSNATLTVSPPLVAGAGGPYTTCATTAVPLAGFASNPSTVSWSSSGTGSFTNGNSLTATYTPSAADVVAGSVTLSLAVNDNSPCSPVNFNAMLTINPLPNNALPVGATATAVCIGGTTDITVNNSQLNVQYQLRNHSTNANVGEPVMGTGGTINLPTNAITATTTFNVFATNSATGCARQLSTTQSITLLVETAISVQPEDATALILIGGSSTTATFSVAAMGSGLVYQWQESTDGGLNFADVTTGQGIATASFKTAPVSPSDSGTQYRCLVTGACGEATSDSATLTVEDADNVDNSVEDGAPNEGDGNNDGIPDAMQENVTSLPNADGVYITFVTPEGTQLAGVVAQGNPSPTRTPANATFPVGFFSFSIHGVTPGGATQVTIILPNGVSVQSYYKFGAESANTAPHWYEFAFNGQTGAQIDGNVITLHFVDGLRGDDDQTANGIITDPGAPVLQTGPSQPSPVPSCSNSPLALICGVGCTMSILSTVAGMLTMARFIHRRRR